MQQLLSIRLRMLLLPLLLALCLTAGQDTARAEDVPELFFPTKGGKPPVSVTSVARQSRPVIVNRVMLDALDISRIHKIRITLFNDKKYVALLDHCVSRAPHEFSWFGKLPDVLGSSLQLTASGDILLMTLTVPSAGKFATRWAADGTHFLMECDPTKAWRCGGGVTLDAPVPPRGTGTPPHGGRGIAAVNTIDIIIFYTTETLTVAGGAQFVNLLAQGAVDQANDSYSMSNCNASLRLVDVQYLSSFAENDPDYGDMLNRFTSDSTVNSERDRQGADLCCLFVSQASNGTYGTIGIAHLLNKPGGESSDPSPPVVSPNKGFSVVWASGATDNYILAHEVGHNLGCGHSLFEDIHNGCYTWSHGYHFNVLGATFITVMAYQGPGLTLTGYYSNPNVLYLGVPTGNATVADNARTIRLTGAVVAANRDAAIFVDKNATGIEEGTVLHPYHTVLAAINNAPSGTATPVNIYVAGYGNSGYNSTGTFNKNVLLKLWSGSSAIIGKP